MQLINEIAHDMVIEELLAEFDAVLDRYNKLVIKASLNEGTLDNVSDDLVKIVAVLENRIVTTKKARDHISKLSSNKLSEGADEHRQQVTQNKDAMIAALNKTMAEMDKFEKVAQVELGTVTESTTDSEESEDVIAEKPATPVDDLLNLS